MLFVSHVYWTVKKKHNIFISTDSKKKEKKKKKKNTHIVSFDEGMTEASLHHVNSSKKYSGVVSEVLQTSPSNTDVTDSSRSVVVNIKQNDHLPNRESSFVSDTSMDQGSVSSVEFNHR